MFKLAITTINENKNYNGVGYEGNSTKERISNEMIYGTKG